jgi:hypothetical protein
MEKILTVAELLTEEAKKFSSPLTPEALSLLVDLVANKHAKNHVEAALNAAARKARAKENPADYGTGEIWVDKESILKAYPLENIK